MKLKSNELLILVEPVNLTVIFTTSICEPILLSFEKSSQKGLLCI